MIPAARHSGNSGTMETEDQRNNGDRRSAAAKCRGNKVGMSGRGTGDCEGTETILYSTVTTDISLYNCRKLQNIQQKGRAPNVKPWTLGNNNVSTLVHRL